MWPLAATVSFERDNLKETNTKFKKIRKTEGLTESLIAHLSVIGLVEVTA